MESKKNGAPIRPATKALKTDQITPTKDVNADAALVADVGDEAQTSRKRNKNTADQESCGWGQGEEMSKKHTHQGYNG